MIAKLLTEHRLEFLSLKGGCRGLSESTLVKIPHCWKSHALAHLINTLLQITQKHSRSSARCPVTLGSFQNMEYKGTIKLNIWNKGH